MVEQKQLPVTIPPWEEVSLQWKVWHQFQWGNRCLTASLSGEKIYKMLMCEKIFKKNHIKYKQTFLMQFSSINNRLSRMSGKSKLCLDFCYFYIYFNSQGLTVSGRNSLSFVSKSGQCHIKVRNYLNSKEKPSRKLTFKTFPNIVAGRFRKVK